MSDKIPAALTPEEWKAQQEKLNGLPERLGWAVAEVDAYGDLTPHGLAALCLHGRPFGFTREDLDDLDAAIGTHEAEWSYTSDGRERVERLRGLYDRIEAMLPQVGQT